MREATARERVEEIRGQVVRSLPMAVVDAMREAGVSLTLGSSDATSDPVVIDPNLVDELAEQELLEEMVSYRKDVIGIEHTIFISPKGQTSHSPRVKLVVDPPHSVDPRAKTASIAIDDGSVVAGEPVPPTLLRQVQQFIALNRDVLLDYSGRFEVAALAWDTAICVNADRPKLAERVGFEPTRELAPPGGFQDRCLKPLGHLSLVP